MRLKDAHFLLYQKIKIFKRDNICKTKGYTEFLEKFVAAIDRIIMQCAFLKPLKINKSNSTINEDKIEMYIGILVKDRPTELMNLYMSIQNSLMKLSKKVHIYIFDDESTNSMTLETIEMILKKHPNIVRIRRNHSNNSWNSAHNWAINNLFNLSKNDFDIIGTVDSDMVFTSNWIEVIKESVINLNLKYDLPVQYISIFNSDDQIFHRWKRVIEIEGVKYVIKLRMGGATLFFLKKNFKLYSKSRYGESGKHLNNLDDESRMTRKLLLQGLYCASTFESYAEHLPLNSILNISRKVRVSPTRALNLKIEMFSLETDNLISKFDLQK
jgi:hypothetical protein